MNSQGIRSSTTNSSDIRSSNDSSDRNTGMAMNNKNDHANNGMVVTLLC